LGTSFTGGLYWIIKVVGQGDFLCALVSLCPKDLKRPWWRSGSVNKFEFLRPFSNSCFALYQFYIELKTKSLLTMPSNALPFKPSVQFKPKFKFQQHLV
jgi:hypothetical protein